MNESKGSYDLHVFVCTNAKKSGACCAPRGAEDLRRELKEWTKSRTEWKNRIRVNASGCLDRCSEGIAVAFYPQDRWFVGVSGDPGSSDLENLKKEIETMMRETDADERHERKV